LAGNTHYVTFASVSITTKASLFTFLVLEVVDRSKRYKEYTYIKCKIFILFYGNNNNNIDTKII